MSFLDDLEAMDVEEEKMTNQEYVNDYFDKILGMLEAEQKEKEQRKNDMSNFFGGNGSVLGAALGGVNYTYEIEALKSYLTLMGYTPKYKYDNTNRFSSIKNQMQLAYTKRYREQQDSKFVDSIIGELGVSPDECVGGKFYYPNELIKALADIARYEDGFKKIVCALKVMFEKSDNIMPAPYLDSIAHAVFVKKLNEILDGIVEYGKKHQILNDTDV